MYIIEEKIGGIIIIKLHIEIYQKDYFQTKMTDKFECVLVGVSFCSLKCQCEGFECGQLQEASEGYSKVAAIACVNLGRLTPSCRCQN